MPTRRYDLDDRPFDLRRTWRLSVLWGGTPWRRIDHTGAWHARRTEAGLATVRIANRGDHLEAEGWGDGAELLLDDVPALVGLNDEGVASIEPQHPIVEDLLKTYRGFRLGRTGDVYARAISIAIAQKVTGKNAKSGLRRITWAWGDRAPGPRDDLYVFPDAKTLLAKPYYEFHPLNVEKHRADLLKRLASYRRALERAADMNHADAYQHLLKIRGIGPWTAGAVMGSALGDPDAVPVGDYHLKNIVTFNLAGEPRGTDERMMELLEPYRGNRGRIVRMLKAGGSSPPKWGHRSSVRDIRGQ